MTDPELADATYIEPITPEIVEQDHREGALRAARCGFALLPTMGGQTALNCALSLRKQGTLEKFDVEMIGATAEAIDKAEDRQLFREAMTKIGLETPKSRLANATALKKSYREQYLADKAKLSGEALEAFELKWTLNESDRRKRYQEQALGAALMALSEIGLPAIIAPVLHPGRHRRRHRLQQGRVSRHRRARPRRLAHQRGADRGIRARLERVRDGGVRDKKTTASSSARSKTSIRWACTPAIPSPWRRP